MNLDTCPSCRTPVRPGAKFCVSCGGALGPTQPPGPPAPAANRGQGVRRSRKQYLLVWLRLLTMVLGLAVSSFGVYKLLTTDDPAPVANGKAPAPAGESKPAPTSTAPATKACTNKLLGYSVDYPASWSVRGSDAAGPCQFFNPTPFEVPAAAEVSVAINIYQMEVDFNTLTGQFSDPGLYNVSLMKELTVAGNRAVRVRYRSGDQSPNPGADNYEIVVEHDTNTLVLTAHAPFSADFRATRRVLNAMAASLSLK